MTKSKLINCTKCVSAYTTYNIEQKKPLTRSTQTEPVISFLEIHPMIQSILQLSY